MDKEYGCGGNGEPCYPPYCKGCKERKGKPTIWHETDLTVDYAKLLRSLADRMGIRNAADYAASITVKDAIGAADEIEHLRKTCNKWAEVSQQNFQRAKAAQAALEGHKHGALEAIKLVGQSARNAGLWQGKAEGLAIILTECANDLEQAINGNVHKESMEELIDHARQAVDNLSK
jgi:hypothetical protein